MSVTSDTGKAETLVLHTIPTYSTQLNASQHQMKDDSFVTWSFAKAFDTIQGTIPVKSCLPNKIFYYVDAPKSICTGQVNVKL